MIGNVLYMCYKVSEFSFYPKGWNEGWKRLFFFSVKFVTWTTSTFSGVDNWYPRIWLGMFWKCAVRIRHFHFAPLGSYKDTLCQVWLKLAKWFMSRRFLKVLNVFSLCGYYLPFEKCMASKLNKFESPLPQSASVMFGWNWLSGSWEDFQKLSIYFQFVAIIFS